MIDVKRTSITLPKDILIAIKAKAVEEGTTQSKIIIDVLRKEFEPVGNKKEKIKEMPFTDPDRKGNLKNIIGKGKVENAENIDVNKLIDNIHTKKGLY